MVVKYELSPQAIYKEGNTLNLVDKAGATVSIDYEADLKTDFANYKIVDLFPDVEFSIDGNKQSENVKVESMIPVGDTATGKITVGSFKGNWHAERTVSVFAKELGNKFRPWVKENDYSNCWEIQLPSKFFTKENTIFRRNLALFVEELLYTKYGKFLNDEREITNLFSKSNPYWEQQVPPTKQFS